MHSSKKSLNIRVFSARPRHVKVVHILTFILSSRDDLYRFIESDAHIFTSLLHRLLPLPALPDHGCVAVLPGLLPGLPGEDNVAVLVVILLTHLLPVLPEHGDHAVVAGGD